MEKWTAILVERLEAAYQQRFDKEAALIFLNDAYQEYVYLRVKGLTEESSCQQDFCHQFLALRDAFICQLVDRYPSNYGEIAHRIADLKKISA